MGEAARQAVRRLSSPWPGVVVWPATIFSKALFSKVLFSKTGAKRMASAWLTRARLTSSRVWQEMVVIGGGQLAEAKRSRTWAGVSSPGAAVRWTPWAPVARAMSGRELRRSLVGLLASAMA